LRQAVVVGIYRKRGDRIARKKQLCRKANHNTAEPFITYNFPEGQSFPLIFGVLLWLIYALYLIPNGNFEPVFLPIISFIKIFVAEKVAKSSAEWCRVVLSQILN
jgi:hypothetical protein